MLCGSLAGECASPLMLDWMILYLLLLYWWRCGYLNCATLLCWRWYDNEKWRLPGSNRLRNMVLWNNNDTLIRKPAFTRVRNTGNKCGYIEKSPGNAFHLVIYVYDAFVPKNWPTMSWNFHRYEQVNFQPSSVHQNGANYCWSNILHFVPSLLF